MLSCRGITKSERPQLPAYEQLNFSSFEEAIQFVINRYDKITSDLEVQITAQKTLIRFLIPFVQASYPQCRDQLGQMLDDWQKSLMSEVTAPSDQAKLNKMAEIMRGMVFVPENEQHSLQVILGGKNGDDA